MNNKMRFSIEFHKFVIIFLFLFTSLNAYPSGSSENDTEGITARGAIGRMEAVPSGPLYTGDGGSSIRLAVLAPEVQGDVPVYLPLYIQGLLNNNINKFSAVNLVDRQNLNRIISEQNLSANGRFSDNDFIRIGNLTNTQYFLFGTIQRLSGNRFSLQLSVTEASSGIRKATSMKEGTLFQFEGRAALLNEATAELLAQIGVQLTEAGRQSLLAGNISAVQSQTGLAKGISALAGGAEVEALFNFAQAVSFDPSQLEAISRLDSLTSTISGGTISQRILNDIQARDQWLEVIKETASFFDNHPPFEIVFDPNLTQIGETDFIKRTVNLGMRIALDSSQSGFNALNTLLEGLEKTGRRNEWGFSGWPLSEISPRTKGTVLFNGKQSFNCKVEVELVNDKNKTIGKSSITLDTGKVLFSSGDKNIPPPFSSEGTVRFSNIKAEELTPSLTIVIVSVNGIPSTNVAASGYMKVETGDLDYTGHSKAVNSVAFSSDSRQFISGSSDETVKLWDVVTGREIKTFTRHEYNKNSVAFFSQYQVNSVAFNPDGKQIISGYSDGIVKLWNVTTGREIRTFTGHKFSINSVMFSPDGKQIISGSEDGTIKLWDVTTGREIRTFTGHNRQVTSVAFSPDGKYIISGSRDNTIKLWDTATGRLIRTFSGHTNFIESVAFNRNGWNFISGSWDKTIKIWNIDSGTASRNISGHTSYINSIVFNYDGLQIISGSSDDTVKIWDSTTSRLIRTLTGHISSVLSVCFSPDGKLIISGSDDSTIKLWDAATGRLIRTYGTEKIEYLPPLD